MAPIACFPALGTACRFQIGRCVGPGKRGHIVADTNVSPFARARNVCCGHKFCVRDIKNVSDFVQKHFVSPTNVSQFAQPKKHHRQQCVRNNVPSFTRALSNQDSVYFVDSARERLLITLCYCLMPLSWTFPKVEMLCNWFSHQCANFKIDSQSV